MQTLVTNLERVDAYLRAHFPHLVAQGWRCLGPPASPGRDGCYVVVLGRFSDPDDPEIAVTYAKGCSERLETAIRGAAVAAGEGAW